MMGWPHFTCSFSAATRASTSLMPPPGNGMMKRTGLAGKPEGTCAAAGAASANETTEHASAAKREIMATSRFRAEHTLAAHRRNRDARGYRTAASPLLATARAVL